MSKTSKKDKFIDPATVGPKVQPMDDQMIAGNVHLPELVSQTLNSKSTLACA